MEPVQDSIKTNMVWIVAIKRSWFRRLGMDQQGELTSFVAALLTYSQCSQQDVVGWEIEAAARDLFGMSSEAFSE